MPPSHPWDSALTSFRRQLYSSPRGTQSPHGQGLGNSSVADWRPAAGIVPRCQGCRPFSRSNIATSLRRSSGESALRAARAVSRLGPPSMCLRLVQALVQAGVDVDISSLPAKHLRHGHASLTLHRSLVRVQYRPPPLKARFLRESLRESGFCTGPGAHGGASLRGLAPLGLEAKPRGSAPTVPILDESCAEPIRRGVPFSTLTPECVCAIRILHYPLWRCVSRDVPVDVAQNGH